MANEYNFQFLPLEGRLPGRDFEQQTEDAINGIGNRLVSAEETLAETSKVASEAYNTATEAQSTADAAQATADNATALANAAQSTADSATALANAAQATADSRAPIYHASETTAYGLGSDALYGHVMLSDAAGESGASGGVAVTPLALKEVADSLAELSSDVAEDSAAMVAAIEKAQATADSAATAAATAQATADAAQEAADAAQSTANAAQSTADAALAQAATNASSIDSLRESVSMLTAYEPVGEVDLNDYEEYARLYITAGSANTPSSDEAFFVDVDSVSGSDIIRQMAVSLADGSIYVRWGTETETDTDTDTDGESEETDTGGESEETDTDTDGESEESEESETALVWGDWQLANVEYASDAQVESMLDDVFGD